VTDRPTLDTISTGDVTETDLFVLLPHVADEVGIAVVIILARLVAYAIDNDQRWRRFVFLIFLALVVTTGWWLLADDGIRVLLHDFGRT
jgi:hypothetical protein